MLLVYTTHIHTVYVLMRDEKEGRKKEASKVKQTRQSNTAHRTTDSVIREDTCICAVEDETHSDEYYPILWGSK